MRRSLSLAVALASLSTVTPSRAREPETAALGWVRLDGAEACPSAQTLAKDVEARIGRSVFVSPSVADLLIEARVERKGATLHAVVHTTRPDGREIGRRELSSNDASCADLAEQLTLVIALTIDPDAKLRPKDAPAPAPPPPEPPKKPECPAPRIDVVEREKRVLVPLKPAPWRGEGRLGASATLGFLPGVTPGVLAAGSVEPPGFVPIELVGSAWPERSVDVASGGASFTLLAAELALCPVAALGSGVRAHFCGGLGLGSMRARGFGFDQNSTQAEPLFLADGRVRLSVSLGGAVFVAAGAGLEAALVRPRFFYVQPNGTETDVHRVPPVGVSSEISLGLRFGS